MRNSLNKQIFLAAVLGVAAGIMCNRVSPQHPFVAPFLYLCEIAGALFINLLKMLLIPIVFSSIAAGIANLRAHAQMDRVWKITMLYFLTTSACAALLGLLAMNTFKPGVDVDLTLFQETLTSFKKESLTLSQFFETFSLSLFMNPVKAMAEGQVLPTIVYAAFLGIALVVAGEHKAKTILNVLNEFLDLTMMMVGWIMRLLPWGLFALLTHLIATQDIKVLPAIGKFMVIVLGTTLFHGLIVLPALLFFLTRISPVKFFQSTQEALLTALSTSSSSATLPVTLKCAYHNLRIDKNVAGFVIPLGATINMDGTALYEAMAALFVANLAGIELNLLQQIVVLFTAVIASIGAPGIPSAGLVTMIMVLQSVGLPIEAIAILIPIDRPLDAVRTMVNVEGDLVGSCVVQRSTTRENLSTTTDR